MEEDEFHRVPRGLDTPVPILFWDPAELTVAILLLGLGIILKQPIIGIGGCFGFLQLSKKLKRGAKRGQGMHTMWRFGIEVDPLLKKYGHRPHHNDLTE